MKIRTRTTATIEHEDIEVELSFVPYDDDPTIVQPSPTTLVVGYLVHDDNCENPMKDRDAEGDLYTFGEGVITDDKSAPKYLGLNSFGGRHYDLEYNLEHEGIDERVKEYLTAQIKGSPELTAWMVAKVMETGENHMNLVFQIAQWMEGYRHRDFSSDEDSSAILMLSGYEALAEKAWQELYNEGKIGAYLAVPVRYCANNHGSGTTSIHTTSLEDANAVWVPDDMALENIRTTALPKRAEISWKGAVSSDGGTLRAVIKIDGEVVAECMTWEEALNVVRRSVGEPTHADLMQASEKYASSTLENYAEWANGHSYGIVVETFALEDGKYVQQDEDSCWGFIGYEYPEKELESWVESAVERLEELR